MDQVRVTIAGKTAEGTAAADPMVMVRLEEVRPFARVLAQTTIQDFFGQAVLEFPAPAGGGREWMVTAMFSRYSGPGGQMFLPNADPSPVFTLPLTRLPGKWNAQFTPLAALASPRFDRLRAVVAVSHQVDLKAKGVPAVGDLAANYDAIDGGPQRLAKMALLNLYSVLTDESDPLAAGGGATPWFSYVQRIVRIDQERFVAEVDKTLWDHVTQIVGDLQNPALGGLYSTEPEGDFALHVPNIPPQYDPANNIARMTTVKKKYEEGDFQLTMAQLKTGQYLLDCDMDEHLELALHAEDLVLHAAAAAKDPTDTGTQPVLMHEYIMRHAAEAAGGVAAVDLGYRLV